jgi:hypothetical protein
MTEKALTIIELRAENVKKLKAVTIRPEGSTVVVSGPNGAGKTSVLDSIWFALGGGHATKETPQPVRHGETEAYVELDLGDYTVLRTWRGEHSTLTITSKEGARYQSPQRFLDERIGNLSFDPLAFAHMDDRHQRDALLGLVELPFDPAVLAGRRQTIYEQRTEVGRDLKKVQGHIAAMPDVSGYPMELVSTETAVQELQKAQESLARYERLTEAREQVESTIRGLEAQLERERDTLARVTEEIELYGDRPPTLGQVESMRAAAIGVEEHNGKVRTAVEKRGYIAQETSLQEQSRALTGQLEELDTYKAEAIAAAEMPVPGLGFDDEQVLYRGLPLSQASAAEQLRVSLGIAMAGNPEIRVIRITDGSLLDSNNMRIIEEMASDRGYQVWIERVDETGTVGVVIEDGEVV